MFCGFSQVECQKVSQGFKRKTVASMI